MKKVLVCFLTVQLLFSSLFPYFLIGPVPVYAQEECPFEFKYPECTGDPGMLRDVLQDCNGNYRTENERFEAGACGDGQAQTGQQESGDVPGVAETQSADTSQEDASVVPDWTPPALCQEEVINSCFREDCDNSRDELICVAQIRNSDCSTSFQVAEPTGKKGCANGEAAPAQPSCEEKIVEDCFRKDCDTNLNKYICVNKVQHSDCSISIDTGGLTDESCDAAGSVVPLPPPPPPPAAPPPVIVPPSVPDSCSYCTTTSCYISCNSETASEPVQKPAPDLSKYCGVYDLSCGTSTPFEGPEPVKVVVANPESQKEAIQRGLEREERRAKMTESYFASVRETESRKDLARVGGIRSEKEAVKAKGPTYSTLWEGVDFTGSPMGELPEVVQSVTDSGSESLANLWEKADLAGQPIAGGQQTAEEKRLAEKSQAAAQTAKGDVEATRQALEAALQKPQGERAADLKRAFGLPEDAPDSEVDSEVRAAAVLAGISIDGSPGTGNFTIRIPDSSSTAPLTSREQAVKDLVVGLKLSTDIPPEQALAEYNKQAREKGEPELVFDEAFGIFRWTDPKSQDVNKWGMIGLVGTMAVVTAPVWIPVAAGGAATIGGGIQIATSAVSGATTYSYVTVASTGAVILQKVSPRFQAALGKGGEFLAQTGDIVIPAGICATAIQAGVQTAGQAGAQLVECIREAIKSGPAPLHTPTANLPVVGTRGATSAEVGARQAVDLATSGKGVAIGAQRAGQDGSGGIGDFFGSIFGRGKKAGNVTTGTHEVQIVLNSGDQTIAGNLAEQCETGSCNPLGWLFNRFQRKQADVQMGTVTTEQLLVKIDRVQQKIAKGKIDDEVIEYWGGVVRDFEGTWAKYGKGGSEESSYFYKPQPKPDLKNPEQVKLIQGAINQERAFLQGIQDGTYNGNFESWMQNLHRENYYRKGIGGVFTAGAPYSPGGHTLIVKGDVLPIAEKYKDPYQVGVAKSQIVNLSGIDKKGLPYDVWVGDQVKHQYPDSKYRGEYLTQMQQRLERFAQNSDQGPTEENLALVAQYYQYGVNSRMFTEVNQTLFANQANAMLKKMGLKPIEQGILDFTAMRLQPENFEKYFKDEVTRVNPQLSRMVLENGKWVKKVSETYLNRYFASGLNLKLQDDRNNHNLPWWNRISNFLFGSIVFAAEGNDISNITNDTALSIASQEEYVYVKSISEVQEKLEAEGEIESQEVKQILLDNLDIKPDGFKTDDTLAVTTGGDGAVEFEIEKGVYYLDSLPIEGADITLSSLFIVDEDAETAGIGIKEGNGQVKRVERTSTVVNPNQNTVSKVRFVTYYDKNNNDKFDNDEAVVPWAGVSVKLTRVDQEKTINLNPGWNLLTLEALSAQPITAATLLANIAAQGGEATTVSTLTDGAWKTYVIRGDKSFSGDDFAIEAGKAYFVKALKKSTFTYTGQNLVAPVKIKLASGWNAVGIPYSQKSYQADTLIEAVKGSGTESDALSQWDFGLWDTFVKKEEEGYGNNFDIINNKGYLVRVKNEGEWSP